MTKKERQETAHATLEGLREVGSGWHDLVATAILRGDHKDLGLDRKEFAMQAGGFKLLDSRQAILDLHAKGLSRKAIADVLGVSSERTVARVLYEEGLIKTAPQKALERGSRKHRDEGVGAGDDSEGGDGGAGDDSERVAELEAAIARLQSEVTAAKNANAEERKKLKEDIKSLRTRLREEAKKNQPDETDPDEIAKLEAQLERMTDQMTIGLDIAHTVGLINDAREELAQLISKGINRDQINQIETAMAALNNEYEVAKGTAALN